MVIKLFILNTFLEEQPPFKPDCPEFKKESEAHGGNTGYIEKRMFDFDKKETIKTKQIKCAYFE
jgi:hypothetical protein